MSRLRQLVQRVLTPYLDRLGCQNRLISTSSVLNNTQVEHTPQGIIREATQDDYEQVMDIDRCIYRGRDYLHSLFPIFVRNHDIHSYVYEIDGQVVGFEAAHMVDGGQTIVTRGARVKQEFQGHGVMKMLRKFIVDKLATDHPVKCVSMTTSNTTGLATKPSVMKTNKEILRRNVHIFPYQVSEIEIPEKDDFRTVTMKTLSTARLCELFKDPNMTGYLFPHKRIIVNTVPFKLMPENCQNIQLENPYILVSDKVLKGKTPPSKGIMSLTTWFSCDVGICVDMELYGCSNNFPEVCNHVGHHLRHIRHLGSHGQIMIPHSHTINEDILLCVMTRFGLSPKESPFKTQMLLEEDLTQVGTGKYRATG